MKPLHQEFNFSVHILSPLVCAKGKWYKYCCTPVEKFIKVYMYVSTELWIMLTMNLLLQHPLPPKKPSCFNNGASERGGGRGERKEGERETEKSV